MIYKSYDETELEVSEPSRASDVATESGRTAAAYLKILFYGPVRCSCTSIYNARYFILQRRCYTSRMDRSPLGIVYHLSVTRAPLRCARVHYTMIADA